MRPLNHNDTHNWIIEVSDGQYRIENTELMIENPWPDAEDRLTTGEDRWFAVLTGVEWGSLPVTIDVGTEALKQDLASWDTVVQRGIEVTGDVLNVSTPAGPCNTRSSSAQQTYQYQTVDWSAQTSSAPCKHVISRENKHRDGRERETSTGVV